MKKLDATFRAKQFALAGSVIALVAGQMTVPATAGPREDCAALYRQGVQYTNQHQYAKAVDAHYWSPQIRGNAGPTAWAVRAKDISAEVVRLKAAGILPYWCINHGPTTSLYYKDPDGNVIELFTQIDRMSDESKGYWEPRPWHETFPMYPKTWEIDALTAFM